MSVKKRGAGDVEELNIGVAAPTGAASVVEWDPEAAVSAEPQIQEVTDEFGTLSVSEDLFKARDELLSRLGGTDVMAAALSKAADADGMGIENITGIGVGIRSAAGVYTGDTVVKVFVREKAPVSRLSRDCAIPSSIGGLPTDVEESGELVASTYAARYPRPVPCGVSCGHVNVTAGTIGALVVLDNNRLCILSNNHVLANENNAAVGDAIIQPGRLDGGASPQDRIGVLERFARITFGGSNSVDAAVAFTSFQLVKPQHVNYVLNPTPTNPRLSLSVIKNGRTTQATQGVITAIGVNNVRVRYSAGVAAFNNQVIIQGIGFRPFSQGGDSGSVIVTAGTKQPVALLFAGSTTHTIANPISAVMSALGISRFLGG